MSKPDAQGANIQAPPPAYYEGGTPAPQQHYYPPQGDAHNYYGSPPPQGQYYAPQGAYGQYPPGQYPQGQYPQGQYPPGPYPQQGMQYQQQPMGHYGNQRGGSKDGLFAVCLGALACCCCLDCIF